MITTSTVPPTPAQRLAQWFAKYIAIPLELKTPPHPVYGPVARHIDNNNRSRMGRGQLGD